MGCPRSGPAAFMASAASIYPAGADSGPDCDPDADWSLTGWIYHDPEYHALEMAGNGLIPAETSIWNGFVFVRQRDEGGPPVAEMMAPDDTRTMRIARYANQRINRIVNAEDIWLIERVQRGMQGRYHDAGPIGRSEVCLRAFAARIRAIVPEARLRRAPAAGWSSRGRGGQ